jgi:hypothetical protein
LVINFIRCFVTFFNKTWVFKYHFRFFIILDGQSISCVHIHFHCTVRQEVRALLAGNGTRIRGNEKCTRNSGQARDKGEVHTNFLLGNLKLSCLEVMDTDDKKINNYILRR